MKYGLIGSSLLQSQTRKVHVLIGDYDYNLIQTEDPEEFARVLADKSYSGFNISGRYKTDVVSYLDELSDDARRTGMVNVVKRLPDGRLKGYNAELEGFRYTVRGLVEDRKCVILGTGGSARSCAAVLRELGAREIILVSRDPAAAAERLGGDHKVIGYNRLHLHYDADVLINATPVGQMPDIEHSPITDERLTVRLFSKLQLAVDLIYNPYRTKFLQDARRLTGCHTKSGLEMLIVQAVESKYVWDGQDTDQEALERLVVSVKRKILDDQLNIIAVGMPGSGKTMIFRRYAYEMGLEFIDTDERTEKLIGATMPEMLALGETGMDYYRAMEHQAVKEACKHNGAVIATGGGTVLNPLNRDFLRSNGIVVYVKRPLDMLDVKGRPLSIKIGVDELFGERDRIYRKVADMSILNSRIFGGELKLTGKGNTYNFELKGFVFYIARKIEKYMNDLADNRWT